MELALGEIRDFKSQGYSRAIRQSPRQVTSRRYPRHQCPGAQPAVNPRPHAMDGGVTCTLHQVGARNPPWVKEIPFLNKGREIFSSYGVRSAGAPRSAQPRIERHIKISPQRIEDGGVWDTSAYMLLRADGESTFGP